jgi:hypothetical protein
MISKILNIQKIYHLRILFTKDNLKILITCLSEAIFSQI